MKETRNLEFKEKVTNTFLKTVSAFSNYDGGNVYFGVDDNGTVKGIENINQACLDIENRINDSIHPQPNYSIHVTNNKVIQLNVESGLHKPYLYKGKAYKRNDSATIEVDTLELSRLTLEGQNINYEQLKSNDQQLVFNTLSAKLIEHTHVENVSNDVLRTLNLLDSSNTYNNAAAILSDHNSFPGIDIAKFGQTINVITKRVTLNNISILSAYDKALEVYRDYYQYENIEGSLREKVELIPEVAFREAIANALIHRTWDTSAMIKVQMYDNYIEITSPGGLPSGLSKEEYLKGKISSLRNPIIGNVFYRLGIAEVFGTGILRIKQAYQNSITKPKYEVLENSITVILPVVEENLNLTLDESEVYKLLDKYVSKSISELTVDISFSKSKLNSLLKSLINKEVVVKEGNGRGTRYRIK